MIAVDVLVRGGKSSSCVGARRAVGAVIITELRSRALDYGR